MALWKYRYIIIGLILLTFSAGCIDSSSDSPPLPTMSTLSVPGSNPDIPLLQRIGEVTGQGIPGGTIDTISFALGLTDIHTTVDMERLVIVYADAIRTETLVPVEGFHGDPPKGYWCIERVEKEVGDPNNRLENEERFFLKVNPKAPLVPGQVITIDIKPQNGRSLTIRSVAPQTIKADNLLVPL